MFCDCRTAGTTSTNPSTTAATGGKAAARPAFIPNPRRAVAAVESVQEGADEPARREAVRAHDPDEGRGPEGAAIK